jgi:YidC/Oxa1 family membrane protein insertase
MMSRYFTFVYESLSHDLAGGNVIGAIYGVLVRIIGGALTGLYAVFKNYALAIAILTVGVRAALYPLTAKQVKAMAAMQKLQPELVRLRQKYKDDRAKLNEEVMALYHQHGVNPLGGCLPLLVQAPIMFVIWSAIGVAWGAKATQRFAGAVTDFCTDELGQPSQCAPGTAFVPPWSSLFKAIQHHEVNLLGIDLTRPGSGQRGFAFFLFLVLVGLVAATQWYQQRQMQKSSDVEVNPQAQAIQQVLPVVFGFITYTLAAGLGIYFLVGNLIQIGQQRFLLRHRQEAASRIEKKIAAAASEGDEPKKPPSGADRTKKSGPGVRKEAPAKPGGSTKQQSASVGTARRGKKRRKKR